MKFMRKSALAAGLFATALLLPIGHSSSAHATSREGVYTGELVIVQPGNNRFRLVGHEGTFTAPPGVSVYDFDGKPVQVDFAGDGRVRSITEMPIRIEPITHGMEVISGQLEVVDPGTRRFVIDGDQRTFVAPSEADILGLAGRRVEFHLDDSGRVVDMHPVSGYPMPGAAAVMCPYGGQAYADGAVVCQAALQYRCEQGVWHSLGTNCGGVGPSVYGPSASRSQRTCLVGGASVADGSSICRGGIAYRCADSEWVSLSTACR